MKIKEIVEDKEMVPVEKIDQVLKKIVDQQAFNSRFNKAHPPKTFGEPMEEGEIPTTRSKFLNGELPGVTSVELLKGDDRFSRPKPANYRKPAILSLKGPRPQQKDHFDIKANEDSFAADHVPEFNGPREHITKVASWTWGDPVPPIPVTVKVKDIELLKKNYLVVSGVWNSEDTFHLRVTKKQQDELKNDKNILAFESGHVLYLEKKHPDGCECRGCADPPKKFHYLVEYHDLDKLKETWSPVIEAGFGVAIVELSKTQLRDIAEDKNVHHITRKPDEKCKNPECDIEKKGFACMACGMG